MTNNARHWLLSIIGGPLFTWLAGAFVSMDFSAPFATSAARILFLTISAWAILLIRALLGMAAA